MSALKKLLDRYRQAAATNREAGTYFEELTAKFLRTDPKYKSRYRVVVPYAEFAARRGLDKRDAGIDLVGETYAGGLEAIQCKLYAESYQLQKSDIDSFFTASGKDIYSGRVIVATTSHWSEHAEAALEGQSPPVTKIDLHALEESPIDWAQFAEKRGGADEELVLKQKKRLRPHQENAVNKVLAGFGAHERGKLIMACGTGKTFTSLKIAERVAGPGKRVLFLVPSLALLSQTLTEWTAESETPLRCFAVCSDSDVGKKKGKKNKDSDAIQTFVHELSYPATTSAPRLASETAAAFAADAMTVVFSTYHSIDVVSEAQHAHGLPAFDLIVCDEAHRTTGAKFADEDESHFTKVHDAEFLRAGKRLYMTATPRVYANAAKATAEQQSVQLCSMDDEALYGPSFDVLTFSEAVKRGLLVDYKVIVLAIEESHVNRRLQGLLKDQDNTLRMDDAAKIIGCWKALGKQGLHEELIGDREPMRRAVAFCQVIDQKAGAKVHKVASKTIADLFPPVVEEYVRTAEGDEQAEMALSSGSGALRVEVQHVDGHMNATEKEDKIEWLKEEAPEGSCRILSNVRCLSEGVDVPALDAVLFLTPRSSQIDVVQSVGRVMRNAPGKKRGYVVLPVVIPAGMEPHEALNDNETYRVVWQVLQALRSHDDRFDAMVNKLDLIGKDPTKMEIIAIVDKVQRPPRAETKAGKVARKKREHTIGTGDGAAPARAEQRTLEFEIGEVERHIYAKLVQKVGNRHHWEDWAKDIADIARRHIVRIRGILDDAGNAKEREEFARFAAELRDDLNDAITDDEIVEMLAQHLVTRPVFEALFAGASFVKENAVSRAMQGMLELLESHHIDKEAATLERFYESVKLRASGIESAEGKQKIIVELYDKFFKHAFPRLSERLGIVYTPVEIVDFILHSVADLLKEEFGQTLGSPGVHILDPFTGTGTFITRLLQSGLIEKDALRRKYETEIHANELVLLAYYIAAINIESTYHDVMGGEYVPFEGICLTDTFQLSEKPDLISRKFADNSARRTRQKALDIRVIVGNPPYSVGQGSANDNNQNVAYPVLDQRIADTYAARSTATNRISLYDSYVRAIRWASDRIGTQGLIGFVTNASFIDGAADGLRKCLVEEFSTLYVFNLRGNARTSGERRRREAGNVFGAGSRAPVAISLLIKNPAAGKRGNIFYRDIGDDLDELQKLETIAGFDSVAGIRKVSGWKRIEPDAHGDWLRQRDAGFESYLATGDKDSPDSALFAKYSNGVKTQRDWWAYGPSRTGVTRNMASMIAVYGQELLRFDAAHPGASRAQREARVDAEVTSDASRIAWTRALKADLVRGTALTFDDRRLVPSLYRPFSKEWLYFDRKLNELVLLMPKFFPSSVTTNRVIGVSAGESRSGFSALMADVVPSLHATDMVGSQYFPLYVYDGDADETDAAAQTSLFASGSKKTGTGRRDGITDAGLEHFRSAYPGEAITKEDVFYYVYGILHSPDYRERYADNLGKELPRIPRVRTAADFWAFSKAGRALGDLHVGFEKVPEHPAKIDEKTTAAPPVERYRVTKMRFGGSGREKDKTTIVYNDFVTVSGIPLSAYDYVVNGKPAIEWVMERQSVTTDKASGIVKDANDYANETVGDPRYPLSLLLRVITVSLETNRIVLGLPALDLLDAPEAAPAPKGTSVAEREHLIQQLVDAERIGEARKIAEGTKWERVLAPAAVRQGEPASGADPRPNLAWLRSAENRERYRGRWVALRGGVVLADGTKRAEVEARVAGEKDVRDILVDWVEG
ncbi:MAG: type ISP restriction/modification enzyme [Sandaracinus sp.]